MFYIVGHVPFPPILEYYGKTLFSIFLFWKLGNRIYITCSNGQLYNNISVNKLKAQFFSKKYVSEDILSTLLPYVFFPLNLWNYIPQLYKLHEMMSLSFAEKISNIKRYVYPSLRIDFNMKSINIKSIFFFYVSFGTGHTQQHTPHKIWTEEAKFVLQRFCSKQGDA